MSWETIWWSVFWIALGGNVFGWAMTILRILQNLDSGFAKLCLFSQIVIPLGFPLAFLFGWLHRKHDSHMKVMAIWTAAVGVFVTLPFWDPPSIGG